MPDHVHMMISIPPKYAVSQVIGTLSRARVRSILLASMARGNAILWDSTSGRGHTLVSTIGRDEAVIREYIQKQEQEDLRLDQMKFLCGADQPPSGGSSTTGPRQRPQQPLRAATSLRPPALPGT